MKPNYSVVEKSSSKICILFTLVALSLFIFSVFAISSGWEFWGITSVSVTHNQILSITIDKSAIVRNIGLIFISIIAIALALWRGFIAEHQAEISNQQHAMSQQIHRDTSFKTSLEMIGSKSLSARTGGILLLSELAKYPPYNLSRPILTIMNTFIVNRMNKINDINIEERIRLPQDISLTIEKLHSIVKICPASKMDYANKKTSFVDLDFQNYPLTNKKLNEIGIYNSIFSDAYFKNCEFKNSIISHCKFQNSEFYDCSLSRADVNLCNFEEATFNNVEISGATFTDTEGLTQDQINGMWADEKNPPSGLEQFNIPLLCPDSNK